MPLCSALTLCLRSLRDSLRKDLTPASELLAASSALHPHTCLEGSVSSQERTGTGEKTPYFLEGKQVKTAIRGLLLTKPMGIGRGQHCSPAPWGAGSQKGWCWKGQVQSRVVMYSSCFVLRLSFLILISSVVMRI